MSVDNNNNKGTKSRDSYRKKRLFYFTISSLFFHLVEYMIFFVPLLWITLRVINNINSIALQVLLGLLTFTMPIGLMVVFHGLGTLYYLKSGKYFVRPISDREWDEQKDRNLIHYTDFLTPIEFEHYEKTGFIHLHSNGSRKSNYSMKRDMRSEKFVWFHSSDVNNPNEPNFHSFWNSHFLVMTPRKYKVIITCSELKRDDVYFRPWDNAIILKGDYLGKATIKTSFSWYNEKIYRWEIIKNSLFVFIIMFYVSIVQMSGAKEDEIARSGLDDKNISV